MVGTLGGGIKHPLLWVDYTRSVPEGSTTLTEKVINMIINQKKATIFA